MSGTVAIVGCGLVGRAWAIVFARAGNETRLWDERLEASEAARAFAAGMLVELERRGLIGCSAGEALSRIRVTEDLAEALDGAIHVQESTFEDLAVKRGVFARLDALAGPDTVLASSSSALLPSAISEGLPGRHRCPLLGFYRPQEPPDLGADIHLRRIHHPAPIDPAAPLRPRPQPDIPNHYHRHHQRTKKNFSCHARLLGRVFDA